LVDRAESRGLAVWQLAPGVLERVADTVTPQPVLAVVGLVDRPLEELAGAGLVVVAAGVRDPGNAGTILRSAQAAGADGVVCCGGSVDLYSPKAVRASAGALFHLPVVVGREPVDVLERIGAWGLRRLAATARGGLDYADADLRGPVAVVVGNEAHGLDPALASVVDASVTIPLHGGAESLNVGVATAVLCFEAARQRRAAVAL
ncbi:MAG: TrmH family RNA methyltransferase, partial [Acidimicrobiales bacterium]